jgi:putative two-component system response regulator
LTHAYQQFLQRIALQGSIRVAETEEIDLTALLAIAMSTAGNIYEQAPDSPISSAFHPARILIVDDEVIVREILVRKLESMGYACECCGNGRAALDLIAKRGFDLVLAGILIPEIGGIALLKEAMRICPDIAVILVTSVIDIEMAVDALKDGAYDYITKPFSLEEMSISVSRALEKRRLLLENQNYQRSLEEQVASRTRQLKEALGVLQHTYHSTLVALSRALDSRDAGSDGHSLRVTVYATRLAQKLDLGKPEIRVIEQGVLLHDIGKIGIPDELLRKPGKLDESEWLLMRKHPEIGYRILSSIKFLKGAARLVLHHHERWDGNGYPQKLSGDQINLGARIFAVVNALDDLTSNRSLQDAISLEAALREIEKMSGSQLDPILVDEFLKIPAAKWEEIRREVSANTRRADFLSVGGRQVE